MLRVGTSASITYLIAASTVAYTSGVTVVTISGVTAAVTNIALFLEFWLFRRSYSFSMTAFTLTRSRNSGFVKVIPKRVGNFLNSRKKKKKTLYVNRCLGIKV